MRKLLTVALLLTFSNAWAQKATATPDSQATATETAVVTRVSGDITSPQVSTATVIATPSAEAAQPSTMVTTPSTEKKSVSAMPNGTPAAMPKPPVLSFASTPVANNPFSEHFAFQIDGGSVIPASNWSASAYGMGFGFDARISYVTDEVFSFGLETGFTDLTCTSTANSNFGLPAGATANLSHIPLLLTMQFNMGDPGAPVQPYLLLAGGLAIDSNNLQGATFPAGKTTSWTNFEFDPGVGVSFALDKNTTLFIQGKCAMDFDDYNSGDASAQSSDTPIILVPIQVGMNFSL